MNLNVEKAEEKDSTAWNSFLNQTRHGTIYHTWEWQKILSTAFGWKIIRLICRNNEEILGIYPMGIVTPSSYQVPWEESKYPWAGSLPPNLFGGPIVSDEPEKYLQKTIFKKLIANMEKILVDFQCYKIEIRRGPWDCFIEGILPNTWEELGYEIKKHLPTFIIQLNGPINEIQNNFSREVKKSIKQGKKRGTKIISAQNKNDVLDCYRLYLESMARSFLLPRFNLKAFYMVFELFAEKNLAKFLLAEVDGIRIATLITFYWKDTISGWINGSTSDQHYLRYRPNHLLINYVIEDACRNGYTYFDYGEASTPGLKKFKLGWTRDLLPLYTTIKFLRVNDFKKSLVRDFFVKKILKLGGRLLG